MSTLDWLWDNANVPIRYNLFLSTGDRREDMLEEKLLGCPEVQYWFGYLKDCFDKQSIGSLHGGDDYRFEVYMNRLVRLGMRSNIKPFDTYARFFLGFLERQLESPRDDKLSFGKIYSYYDQELRIAAYLASAGYVFEPAVNAVIDKRIDLLYEFTRQKRYDIFVDGSRYPGVKKEWQWALIDPELYEDGHISFPTASDCILLGAASLAGLEFETQTKVDTIINWLYGDEYFDLPNGYFYAPGGSYSTKSIGWKLGLPRLDGNSDIRGLLGMVYLLSHFRVSGSSDWYRNALAYLKTFRKDSGRYIFPRDILSKDMGMGEDRKKRLSAEIESTYWMEKVRNNPAGVI